MRACLLLVIIGAACAATDFEKQCTPTAEVGPCKAKLPRWWLNTESGKCEPFYYGGCGGNKNRYLYKEQCEKTCAPLTLNQTTHSVKRATFHDKKGQVLGSGEGVCTRPPYTGPCKARFLRFYYDASSKTCRQFTYGGCESNGNNFETQRDCMQVCGGRVPEGPMPLQEEHKED
ncbi:kunitz-type serine protease inhibitor 6-like [Amblyomma americanum]